MPFSYPCGTWTSMTQRVSNRGQSSQSNVPEKNEHLVMKSLNIRGLQSIKTYVKWKYLLSLKDKADVLGLQETHNSAIFDAWKYFGIKSFSSSTSTGKGGVSLIFFHPSTIITSTQILIPNYAILVNTKIKEQSFTFINIYIPPGNLSLENRFWKKCHRL